MPFLGPFLELSLRKLKKDISLSKERKLTHSIISKAWLPYHCYMIAACKNK